MSDAEAFERLFRAHVASVHAFALRRSDPETADEVVADTFLVCWRRLHRVPDDPLPWLYAVARRCLANRLRKRSRTHHGAIPVPPALSAADSAERRGELREVLAALTRLSAKDREALRLCAWEGLNASDAAIVAGCTAPTMRVRVHRARRRLAALLDLPDAATNPRKELA
jgi:RNA polymerase sigma-70 factor (ECF subfamily)